MKKQKRVCASVLMFLLLVTLPGAIKAGVTGKLAGKVVDSETKDPLAGANVIVEGTNMGAATNQNGEFIIINVPPGSYSLRAHFIGYRSVTMKNILVSVDLTTTANFELPSEALELSSVVITAERPLVEKNATNEIHVLTANDIKNMPMRDYLAVVATNSGVVTARTDLYVRGGRRDEVAYYVDGVYTNDLRTGVRVGDIPINSVEQINYQAGGFNAEYGFANSGVVVTSSKSGANNYQISGEVITDEFLSETDKNLGAYSYGYNAYNLAISGPLLSKKLKFFGAAEYNYQRDRQPSSSHYPVLANDFTQEEINYSRSELEAMGVPFEEWIVPITFENGALPNNFLKRWTFNGNLLFDLNTIKFKLGGNGTLDNYSEYVHQLAINSLSHSPYNEDFSYSIYGKVTHSLGPRTYYDATAYYSSYGTERMDPVFKRNVMDYGDKTDFNDNGLFAPYLSQNGLNTSDKLRLGTGVFLPLRTFDEYELNRANVLGAKYDMTHQVGLMHELRTGFEYRYHTLRRYNITRPIQLAGAFSTTPDLDPRLGYRTGYTENFGYPSYFENDIVDPDATLNSGLDDAKHPIVASFYLQDKIELSDLILNLGLRWDYIDANDQKIRDPYNIVLDQGFMDSSNFVSTSGHSTISPRIGLSFPITDRTVFHAQWGKFTQQPELQYLYTGWDYYAGQVSQGNQVAIGNPDLKPIKTTAYEIGFGQQLGLNASLNITAYYKEIRDLIVIRNRTGARPTVYAQYQNGDFGTVKGLSFNFKMRRTQRISANVNYTLQWARGTGSTSGSAFYITWIGNEYYPTFVTSLDFDQRHTMSANIDFRTDAQDGPKLFNRYPFSNMGVNMLMSIGSGFPYTPKRIADTIFGARFSSSYPVAAMNSAYTNWNYNIDMRVDKDMQVGNLNFNVYLWVTNLLGSKLPFQRRSDMGAIYDRQNAGNVGVYEATGSVDDNGYLDTVAGQRWVQDNGGARAEELYRAAVSDARNWESPRQIRLGVRFDINP